MSFEKKTILNSIVALGSKERSLGTRLVFIDLQAQGEAVFVAGLKQEAWIAAMDNIGQRCWCEATASSYFVLSGN